MAYNMSIKWRDAFVLHFKINIRSFIYILMEMYYHNLYFLKYIYNMYSFFYMESN